MRSDELRPPPENELSLSDAPEAAQAGRIHLIVGPVGAGKSTLAATLADEHAALRLSLDEWMSELFSPDRPASGVVDWYVERAARCNARIWAIACAALRSNVDVVLEIGLLRRAEREAFIQRAEEAGFALELIVVEAAREVRRRRVAERNQRRGPTFSMVVPEAVFELASDLWEPVEPDECAGRDVRVVCTDPA